MAKQQQQEEDTYWVDGSLSISEMRELLSKGYIVSVDLRDEPSYGEWGFNYARNLVRSRFTAAGKPLPGKVRTRTMGDYLEGVLELDDPEVPEEWWYEQEEVETEKKEKPLKEVQEVSPQPTSNGQPEAESLLYYGVLGVLHTAEQAGMSTELTARMITGLVFTMDGYTVHPVND